MLSKMDVYARIVSNTKVLLQLINVSFKEYVLRVMSEGVQYSDIKNMEKIVQKLIEIQDILE